MVLYVCCFPLPFPLDAACEQEASHRPSWCLGSGWFLTQPWDSPSAVAFLSAADSLCTGMVKQLSGGRGRLWFLKFFPIPLFTGSVTLHKFRLLVWASLPCPANGLFSTWLSGGSITRICHL